MSEMTSINVGVKHDDVWLMRNQIIKLAAGHSIIAA